MSSNKTHATTPPQDENDYIPYPTLSMHAHTKYTELPSTTIKQLFKDGLTVSKLARQFNTTRHKIYSIIDPTYAPKRKQLIQKYNKDKRHYDTYLRRLHMKRYRLRKSILGYSKYNPTRTIADMQEEYDQLIILIREYRQNKNANTTTTTLWYISNTPHKLQHS